MDFVTSVEELESLYGQPGEASLVKEADRITPQYRRLIEASPFMALATAGPEGLDCSPRGELGGVAHVEDEKTLMLPDRRGNNRIDSLRNVLRDPRVGLLFLIPGSGTTLRVNGRARISADPALLQRFSVDGKPPRSVLVIAVEAVYFQCSRAVLRAELWNPAHHLDPKALPTPGQILAELSEARVGGEAYDREWPARARASMW
ncbi:MAG TPA: pyridoxamine 5'-phosphate oxidase family protein [Kiloniellaceae bacterium]|nr:pyridoxamine 5'-phosphate oxidase family protein [Kiloniellaceae bacterium]